MGAAKQLRDFAGKPMLRFAAETALASECVPFIVVLGGASLSIPAL
jgi:CTP:molybdopterin cytidylyltransferase MocA